MNLIFYRVGIKNHHHPKLHKKEEIIIKFKIVKITRLNFVVKNVIFYIITFFNDNCPAFFECDCKPDFVRRLIIETTHALTGMKCSLH